MKYSVVVWTMISAWASWPVAIHATEIPDALLQVQKLKLSSLNGDRFACQFYRSNKNTGHDDRWWVSSNDRPVMVTFIMSRFPLGFHCQNSISLLTPERIFRQAPAPVWCASFNGHLLAYGTNTVPPDGNSFVAVDIPSSLSALVDETPVDQVQIKFKSPRTWHFEYRDNVSAELTLRTPNDSLVLGTSLGRCHIQTTPEVQFGISALTVDSRIDLLIGDVDFKSTTADVAHLPELSQADLLSDNGRRSLDGYRVFAAMSTVSVEEAFSQKRETRRIIRELESRILAEGEIHFSKEWIRDFCSLCSRSRNYATQSVDNTKLPIDDPGVRWSRIEQILEMKLFFAAERVLPEILLNQPKIPLEYRIRLVDARADLGESQFIHQSTMFDAEHGDLYRSILNAHHQHPSTNADIQRCHDYLEKVPENSPASHCLIESLILMGEIDKLSPEVVDRWYGDVMFAGTREDQLEVLRQITLVHSGREWLRKRLRLLEDQLSETDHLALNALHQRASATQKSARWDFMSEQECDATLSLVEKQGQTQ